MLESICYQRSTQEEAIATDYPNHITNYQKGKHLTYEDKGKKNKRVLGRSIEEGPDAVDTGEEFGHWETDLIIGQKSEKDAVLLTLPERKTRDFSTIRLPDKSSDSVLRAFQKIQKPLPPCRKDGNKLPTSCQGKIIWLRASRGQSGSLLTLKCSTCSCNLR